MKHIDNIIVGGGISGYSFANQFKRNNLDYLIFEKDTIGGCINTQQYQDFWFELGGHTIYNSYANTIEYIKNNSLENCIIKRDNPPFLFVKENNQISAILRNINPISGLFSFIKNRKLDKVGKSVQEYAECVFGKKNYQKTLKYCFDAVLSQDSHNFPMEYLFKKYPRDENLPRSFTLKNGLGGLFTDDKNVIKSEVLSIHKENNLWIVQTPDTKYSCDNLCIATEWHQTAKLIKNITPSLSNHRFQPELSKIRSISVVIENGKIKHLKKIAGLIGKKQFFYSVVSRDIIEQPNLRGFTFHCKDSETSIAELLKSISNVLKIKIQDIEYYYEKQNTLPKYNLKHSVFIEDLNNFLKSQQGLYISGNFFDRLAIENCIKRSNEEFLRLKQHLNN